MPKGPAKQIFVNLSVKDLKKTMEFFKAIGFTFNPKFTDDKAACLVIGDNIFAMLILEKYFKTFNKKAVTDTSQSAEVMLAIAFENRQKVDEIADKALKSGGSPSMPPQDHGWMYSRSFQDPDGHLWETFTMDESNVPAPNESAKASS